MHRPTEAGHAGRNRVHRTGAAQLLEQLRAMNSRGVLRCRSVLLQLDQGEMKWQLRRKRRPRRPPRRRLRRRRRRPRRPRRRRRRPRRSAAKKARRRRRRPRRPRRRRRPAKKAAAKKAPAEEGRGEEGACEEGRRQEGAGEEGGCQEGPCEEGCGQEARCEESREEARCEEGCGRLAACAGACRACCEDHAEPAGSLAVPDGQQALSRQRLEGTSPAPAGLFFWARSLAQTRAEVAFSGSTGGSAPPRLRDLERAESVAQRDAALQRPAALEAEQQRAAQGVAAAGRIDDRRWRDAGHARPLAVLHTSQPSAPSVTTTPRRCARDIASSAPAGALATASAPRSR